MWKDYQTQWAKGLGMIVLIAIMFVGCALFAGMAVMLVSWLIDLIPGMNVERYFNYITAAVVIAVFPALMGGAVGQSIADIAADNP